MKYDVNAVMMTQRADSDGAAHPSLTPLSRARNLAFHNETPAGPIATPNQIPRTPRGAAPVPLSQLFTSFRFLGHDSVRDRTGQERLNHLHS